MQFKNSQWVIEIGSGIAILLLASAALMLAMQNHPAIPQTPVMPQNSNAAPNVIWSSRFF